MKLVITYDNLTPFIKGLPRKIKKNSIKQINNLLKFGQIRAMNYVKGQGSQDLKNNISVFPATNRKAGYLISTSKHRSHTGFPYHLWVNNTIKHITGRFPFFSDGKQVKYGDRRFKATWRMTAGYFDKTYNDMLKQSPKYFKRVWRNIK